jgi:hypothetical protein
VTIANANTTVAGVSAPAVGVGPLVVFEGDVRIDGRSDGHAPVEGGRIRASKSSIVAVTPDRRVFGSAIENDGSSSLLLLYGKETVNGDELLSQWKGPLLQVGRLRLSPGAWTVCLNATNYERCFELDAAVVKSFTASLPAHGNYVLRASSLSQAGHLEGESGAFFAVDGLAFVPEVKYVDGDVSRPAPTRGPDSTPSQSEANRKSLIIGVSVGAAVVVIALVIVAIVCCRRRRKTHLSLDSGGKYTDQYGIPSTGTRSNL